MSTGQELQMDPCLQRREKTVTSTADQEEVEGFVTSSQHISYLLCWIVNAIGIDEHRTLFGHIVVYGKN